MLSVVVLTYRRLEALKRTLHSFRKNVDVPNYEIIVCDDGSSDRNRQEIERLGADKLICHERVGYGINANSGIRAARGDYLFHLEDDVLVVPRNHFLRAGIRVLEALPELGCIKYEFESCLAKHRVTRQVANYNVEILPFPNAKARGFALFCYGNRPHLKHRRFHERYGMYPEGYDVWTTELMFVARVNQCRYLRLAWIRDSAAFWHIGPQYGTTGHDPLRVKPLPYDFHHGLPYIQQS